MKFRHRAMLLAVTAAVAGITAVPGWSWNGGKVKGSCPQVDLWVTAQNGDWQVQVWDGGVLTKSKNVPSPAQGTKKYSFPYWPADGEFHDLVFVLGNAADIEDGKVSDAVTVFDCTIPAGQQGPKGDPGPAGPGGPAGPKGDNGAAGPKGDTGPPGPAGPKGDQGNAGSKGDKGDAGPAGAKGDAGPKGDVGPAGPAGAKGDAGPAGPAGPQGGSGPAGPAGAQGPAGPAGGVGPPGPAGSQGLTAKLPAPKASAVKRGPAGPQGPKGDKGAKGDRGAKGSKGDRGPRGKTPPVTECKGKACKPISLAG